MIKKSPRTEAEAVWDRKIGAALAFIRNRDAQQTQAVFAERIGISRSLLANVESGRTPLTARLGWKFCREFDCHPSWICVAGNSRHPNVFPKIDDDKLAKIEKVIHAGATLPFRNVWPSLAWLIGDTEDEDEDEIKEFDSITVKSNTEGVKAKTTETQKLRDDLHRATAKPGMKAKLARVMKVAPARVSEWLAGQEPGGENALKLRDWADEQLGRKRKQ